MIGNCELIISCSCFTKCDVLGHRFLIRICPLIFTPDVFGLYLEMFISQFLKSFVNMSPGKVQTKETVLSAKSNSEKRLSPPHD